MKKLLYVLRKKAPAAKQTKANTAENTTPTHPRLLHALLKPEVILAVMNSRRTTFSLQRRKRHWGAEVRAQALVQRSPKPSVFFP